VGAWRPLQPPPRPRLPYGGDDPADEDHVHPVSGDGRLALGQRLLLGLAFAPAALLMAVGALDELATYPHRAGTIGVVVDAVHALALIAIGSWTLTMAVTGRGPDVSR
jgi:hypothetical protein